MSVHVFGQMTVVVNTIEAAKEMFQRRSTIYSDRPRMPTIDLCVHDYFFDHLDLRRSLVLIHRIEWSGTSTLA